jgi:hypothetical protein
MESIQRETGNEAVDRVKEMLCWLNLYGSFVLFLCCVFVLCLRSANIRHLFLVGRSIYVNCLPEGIESDPAAVFFGNI